MRRRRKSVKIETIDYSYSFLKTNFSILFQIKNLFIIEIHYNKFASSIVVFHSLSHCLLEVIIFFI